MGKKYKQDSSIAFLALVKIEEEEVESKIAA
jgi:hypothetical protein